MTAELKSTSEGRTMVLTLSNPSQQNALVPDMYAAGIEALGGAESNPDVRCVIIVGEGACFSAGQSLQYLQAYRERDPRGQAEDIEALHSCVDAIRTFPKPVIAAVEGIAAGAGFSIAMACDLVVAARDAVFAASFGNAGLSPNGGLSWHLAQALPRQIVSEWLMKGEHIGAPRLHALGLVNELSDAGQALRAAMALARALIEQSPNALASIKELISDGRGASLSAQLASERDHFMRNLHQVDTGIGPSTISANRSPRHE